MQYFGELISKYDEVFVTSSYMYFNRDDEEEITPKELKQKIKTAKDRKKNIVGTVIIYNPVVTPVGFDSNKFLLDQDFDNFNEMIELKSENYITVYKQALNDTCKGKIVEIKNLFNLNEEHIDAQTLLVKFNDDLERYNSAQNTAFDRDLMYLDAVNMVPNGKFILFSWGEKISTKEFPDIQEYAKAIFDQCTSLGKNIVFTYKKERSKEGAISYLQFGHPMQSAKLKHAISHSTKKIFLSTPPAVTYYE